MKTAYKMLAQCAIFIVSNLWFCGLLAQNSTYMKRIENKLNELPLTWEGGCFGNGN